LKIFLFPFFEERTCSSQNLIYLIKCKKCNVYYIGETGQSIKKRINGHLSTIRCYVPFQFNAPVVAEHFNKNGHDFSTDFCFNVLKLHLSDKEKRLFYENVFINLFQYFNLNLINKLENKSSFFSYSNSFDFQFFHDS